MRVTPGATAVASPRLSSLLLMPATDGSLLDQVTALVRLAMLPSE